MAKYECNFTGNFNEFLDIVHNGIMKGSISASFEDGSDFQAGEIRCAVRVYERYSMIGSNRVSLNITLLGNGRNLYLSAITSGGSQAVFFKINTWGEEAFLDHVAKIVKNYKRTLC
jgi:hypothetical protein